MFVGLLHSAHPRLPHRGPASHLLPASRFLHSGELVHRLAQGVIVGHYHPLIGLIGSRGGDQLHHLGHHVDIRLFHKSRGQMLLTLRGRSAALVA